VQDDIEDWREEGRKMACIYSEAHLTLAASANPDSGTELYSAEDPKHFDVRAIELAVHEFSPTDGSPYSIRVSTANPSRHKCVQRELPLQQRAWFFQEWLLSPRIVHFTPTMLYWKYSTLEQSEDASPLTRSHMNGIGRRTTLTSFTQSPPHAMSALSQLSFQSFVWHELIRSYSKLQLSLSTDIFPALQGVTTRMVAKRQSAYYAGLWEDTLVVDLLWRSQLWRSQRGPPQDPRPDQTYLAPS
jgi:hypothetical protein